MAPQDRIPNELWLEILKNIPKYGKSTGIDSFSLTCRNFRRVSRPFIFADLRFTVYRVGAHETLLLPSPSEVDRLLDRINFLSSTDIAPFVRFCDISARQSWRRDSLESEWSFSTDSPDILLDALFERLVCFTGLQRLDADHIRFTQARVDVLCRLPVLSKLYIYWWTVAPGETIVPSPQALRVSDFRDYTLESTEDDYWLPLLHPDHLHTLHVSLNPRFLGRTVHTIPFFPKVHKLRAIMDLPTPSQNLIILSKFPAVRVLKLDGKGLLTTAQTRSQLSVFPVLKVYSGPYQPLPLFFPVSLTHLTINPCAPQDLITRIQCIPGSHCNITAFHAKFNFKFDTTAFNTIIELFPQLTELLIRICFDDSFDMFEREIYDPAKLEDGVVVSGCFGDSVRTGFKPSTFFLKLADAPILPPGLEQLAISWECHGDELYNDLSAYKLPDFAQLREALVARCPGLKWLWLDGYYFMLLWRLMLDGTVEEFTAKDCMSGAGIRQGGEIFRNWEPEWY
ncbi:hypothetical protein C8J57DRAFT_124808 [Mycena rebaudengoi]|nr:hypothetical protein C8J57DRAFT_124808 [Mycena rebaudengoi]